MNTTFHLFAVTVTVTIAVASAYVSHPHLLTHRCLVGGSRARSWYMLRHELATNNGNGNGNDSNSFEENRDPNNGKRNSDLRKPERKNDPNHSSLIRSQNVARFCFEIGCTTHAYQRMIERLKRRKRALLNQMLAEEDEQLGCLEPGPNWWSTFPKAFNEAKRYASSLYDSQSNIGSFSSSSSVSLPKEEQRNQLSDRALAIQNLLATLQAMEERGTLTFESPQQQQQRATDTYTYKDTTTSSTAAMNNELANRLWRIGKAERIDIFAMSDGGGKPGPKFGDFPVSYWKSPETPRRQPQPPRLPPTVKQYENQCYDDHTRRTIANSDDDDIDEGYSIEWFCRNRVSTFPVSTSAASKKLKNMFGTPRVAIDPFIGDADSTSTPG